MSGQRLLVATERLSPPKLTRLQARILVERYGMDGRPPRSLEEVARAEGISRVALRLVEAMVVSTLRRTAR